jgi:hypothetical protein
VQLGEKASTTLTTAGYFSTADTVTATIALASYATGATAGDVVTALSPTVTPVDTATANTDTTSNGQVVQTAVGQVATISPNRATDAILSGRTTFSITPTAVGTYTYTITSLKQPSGTVAAGTAVAQTWTVVVNPATLSSAPVFIGATVGTLTADAAATALTASGTAATAAVAKIQTVQYRTGTTQVVPAAAKSVVVSVTGAGLLASTDGAAARGSSITVAAGTAAANDFFLHADGRTGTSTITVTIDGVTTVKTFTFVGSMATLSATAPVARHPPQTRPTGATPSRAMRAATNWATARTT